MRVRALVTGAGGQDGSYLAEQLLAEGSEVHGLLLPGEPVGHAPDGVVVHRGDVTDVAATRALVRELEPDEVYHLAALSSVARSWAEPDLTSLVNGHAAGALLESARLCQEATGRPVRFVQASSSEVFGDAAGPQDESTPLRPVNPYGAAKAFAHHLVGVHRHRGLHAVAVILYNHESPRRPAHFVTRKITSTVAAIARGQADRLVLGDLDVRRDWGWAPEHVDAMVRAARHPVAQDYVVATGRSHSVREFVAAAFAAAGVADWEPLVVTDPALRRTAEARDVTAVPRRAAEELGWVATATLDDVARRMVEAERPGR